MTVSSSQQMNMFLISVIVGIACAFVFDLQRFARKKMRTGEILTNLEDLAFAIVLTAAVIASGYVFNRGNLRYYQILGAAFGMFVYMLFFSRFVMKVTEIVFKIFVKLFVRPIAFLLKFLIKVFRIVEGALKRIFRLLTVKLKKYARFMLIGAKSLKKRVKML